MRQAVAHVGNPVALVGDPVALVGRLLAQIRGTVAPIGDVVPFVGDSVAHIADVLPVIGVVVTASCDPVALVGTDLALVKRWSAPAFCPALAERDRASPSRAGSLACGGRTIARGISTERRLDRTMQGGVGALDIRHRALDLGSISRRLLYRPVRRRSVLLIRVRSRFVLAHFFTEYGDRVRR